MADIYFADIKQRRLADTTAIEEQLARLGNRHKAELDACLAALALTPPELKPLTAMLAPTPEGVKPACAEMLCAARTHLTRFKEAPLADVAELAIAGGGESLTVLAENARRWSEAWQARHFCRGEPNAAVAFGDDEFNLLLDAAARAVALKRSKMAAVDAAAALLAEIAEPDVVAARFDYPITALGAVSERLGVAGEECDRRIAELHRILAATRLELARQRDDHVANRSGLEMDLKRLREDFVDLVHRLEGLFTKIAARDAAVRAVAAALEDAEAEFRRRITALETTRAIAAEQGASADAARAVLRELAQHCGEMVTCGKAAVGGVREAVKMAMREAHWAVSNPLVVAATLDSCPLGMRSRIEDELAAMSREADSRCERCSQCPSCPLAAPPSCDSCRGCGMCAAAQLDPNAAIAGFDPRVAQSHHPLPTDDAMLRRRAREAMLRGVERLQAHILEEKAVRAADAATAAVRATTRGLMTLVVKRPVELRTSTLETQLSKELATLNEHLDAIRHFLSDPLAKRGLRPHLLAKMAHADLDANPPPEAPATAAAAPAAAAASPLGAAVGELRQLLGGKVADTAHDAWEACAGSRAALLAVLDALAAATAWEKEPAPAAPHVAAEPCELGVVWANDVGKYMLRDAGGTLRHHIEV